MSTTAISDIECWNCGAENKVVYGGATDKGVHRCDNCDEVIAEKTVDALTIPGNKEQAESIKDRHGSHSIKERLKRAAGWK